MPLIEMAAGTNTVPRCTRVRCLVCPSIYLDIVHDVQESGVWPVHPYLDIVLLIRYHDVQESGVWPVHPYLDIVLPIRYHDVQESGICPATPGYCPANTVP